MAGTISSHQNPTSHWRRAWGHCTLPGGAKLPESQHVRFAADDPFGGDQRDE